MAKRRSCRRTENETVLHEKAVKIRKMTDEQLVHYIEDRVEKARSEGYNKGRKTVEPPVVQAVESVEPSVVSGPGATVQEFLERLKATKIQGIGAVTLKKLMNAAEEYGYIQ